MRVLLLPSLLGLLAACGSTGPSDPTEPAEGGEFQVGMQYKGSVALDRAGEQRIELSAPLFPDMTVFEKFQDASIYPTLSDAERQQLVDDNVRTFEELLPPCAAKHPAITLQGPGDPPLTTAQIATNYDEVARCAYEDYGAKPYWVPQHVSDVDICVKKLGQEWRLPTETDVAGMSEAELQFFQDTLTAQPGKDWFPVHFYYSLDIYVRGDDGTLKLGNLAPQTDHVVPLPIASSAWTELYTGNGKPIGVRCLRLSTVAP